MRVKYEDYIAEVRRTEAELERRTCVKDIGMKIWFVNTGSEVVWLSLNVGGTGNILPTTATRFAECIKEAAVLAKNFKYNGYVIK